jgi:hypothetical protein
MTLSVMMMLSALQLEHESCALERYSRRPSISLMIAGEREGLTNAL